MDQSLVGNIIVCISAELYPMIVTRLQSSNMAKMSIPVEFLVALKHLSVRTEPTGTPEKHGPVFRVEENRIVTK